MLSFCASALLGVMSTDLSFFESSVPVVPLLYKVFVAIGWGILIGNCAFQSLKAMFAGLGFETESPAILLIRTAIFGTLLIFSKDICEIGLSIGKKTIDLIGMPSNIHLSLPNQSFFMGSSVSWLLVIIIGFILGFQLIKLFFEIAERYVVVGILTLLCPVALATGGSKSTKDICVGFMRMYVSMIVMMVLNVLFLKLIISALATVPRGYLIVPWCLLIVGIARTARKADQMISKIGLNPAFTGDPLGSGRGMMLAVLAARSMMYRGMRGGNTNTSATRASGGKGGSNKGSGGKTHNNVGGTNVGGNNTQNGGNNANNNSSSRNSQNSNQTVNNKGGRSNTTANNRSNNRFGSSGQKTVNTNRFGTQNGGNTVNNRADGKSNTSVNNNGNKGYNNNGNKGKNSNYRGNGNHKGNNNGNRGNYSKNNNYKNNKQRFGSQSFGGGIKHNKNPLAKGNATPNNTSAVPNNITDNVKEKLKNAADNITKDGDSNG